jgi:shikimate kinase
MRQRKKNIILIGFMGSGKTSVGKVLAGHLSYRFCDTDEMLERKAGDTINHIFAIRGEEYFRLMETELLKEMLPDIDRTVISTGGGLPLREQNAELLKKIGYVVFLKASKETTVQRLRGDRTRPLLQGGELEQKVEKLLDLRTPLYERAAHKIIITDNSTIEDIAVRVMEEYLKQTD